MSNLKKIFFLLPEHLRKRFILLVFLISFMAIIDTIGIASVLPFITAISNPELIESNQILKTIYNFSIKYVFFDKDDFIYFLGICTSLILVFSILLRFLLQILQIQFIETTNYSLTKKLIEIYLHQPYHWFLNKNSTDLSRNILSEVDHVVGGAIRPLIEFLSKGVMIFLVTSFLVFLDPKIALFIFLLISIVYSIIFYLVKKIFSKLGNSRLINNKLRFDAIDVAFGAIKQIKLQGSEQRFIDFFSKPALLYSKSRVFAEILIQFPRSFIEIISFSGIILLIIFLTERSGTFFSALPMIGLYVFAGYRLLPAVQNAYASISSIKINSEIVKKLYDDINKLKPYKSTSNNLISFDKTIELVNIYFDYPFSKRKALKNINMTINAKTTIGLVGTTGSGKTTIVDIISGLLKAQQGDLKVDGKIVNEDSLSAWQNNIGYVPQYIYLTDDSIASNISFGVDKKNIKQEDIEKVAKIASLHEFIMTELPEKYETKIGEQGVRLSGGQRQRIGLARALYRNPKLLILDEATNSLDSETEKKVMREIYNLNHKITIIIIAHRLNTVKNCDTIYKIENGMIVDQGSYKSIMEK